jgi:hypothetical protein
VVVSITGVVQMSDLLLDILAGLAGAFVGALFVFALIRRRK